jgi:cytochrome c553
MASYHYRCAAQHTMFVTYPMGTAPRIVECPSCHEPMLHVLGVGVQVAPVKAAGISDSALSKDLEAYRRLRDGGTQPESPIGAAQLEREVSDQFDVQYRDLYQYASKQTIKDAVEEAAQYKMGIG